MSEHRNYSEAIARKIDKEVRQIIGRAYDGAIEVMTKHRDLLDDLARSLVQNETLSEAEVETLLASAPS